MRRIKKATFFSIFTIAVIILSVALLSSGCGSGNETKDDDITATRAKEYSNPDNPIDVKTGDYFTIVLDSNPSTGYSWELAGQPDSSILEFKSQTYKSTGDEDLAGAGGKEYWKFQALKAGTTKVSLRYVRSWEENVEPAETAEFTVNVSE